MALAIGALVIGAIAVYFLVDLVRTADTQTRGGRVQRLIAGGLLLGLLYLIVTAQWTILATILAVLLLIVIALTG